MTIEDLIGNIITEGKTKIIFEHKEDPTLAIMQMKDMATAGDGKRKEAIPGKALATWEIASRMMDFLNQHEFPTAYVASPEAGYMIVKNLEMAPLELISRKILTGSILKKFPVTPNIILGTPSIEVDLKYDDMHDPTIGDLYSTICNSWNPEIAKKRQINGKLIRPAQLHAFKLKTQDICNLLHVFFFEHEITFYDLKLEIGVTKDGEIMFGDYLSPDEMRLRRPDGSRIDKQGFRDGQSIEETAEVYKTAVGTFREIMSDYGKFKCELPDLNKV